MVKIQRRHCFISSSDLLQFKTRKVQANNIVQIFWIKFSFSFPAESQPAHQLFPLCKAGWERRYFCLKTFQQTWQPRVFPRQLLWGQLLQTTAGKKFTWRCFSTFFISSWSASRYSCQMSITETHNLFSQQNPWREKKRSPFFAFKFLSSNLILISSGSFPWEAYRILVQTSDGKSAPRCSL